MDKKKIHQLCVETLAQKIDAAKHAIHDAQLSANDDTKSSAGDKHETGRAMAQLEVEKRHKAMSQLTLMQGGLSQINSDIVQNAVRPGALITTTAGVFYISVGLGKLAIGNSTEVMAVSFGAPLIQSIKGLSVGDSFQWQNVTHQIDQII